MAHPFVYAVRRECLSRKVSPEQLAHRTGFSGETIRNLLKGKSMLYSPDLVDWLADAFELRGYQRRAFFEEAGLTLAEQGDRVFYRVFIQFCQERHQTVESVARQTGLHPTHIEAFLKGDIFPNWEHLEELADALDLQNQDRLMFFRAGGYDIPELSDEDNGSFSPLLEPLRIFYCYAQEDLALQQELDKHLGLLKRKRMVTTWHSREIQAGTHWEQEIAEHLQAANLILLLISPDFIASDYCYGTEMQQALAFHEESQTRVVPILLRPVDWRGAPFAQLPILPYNKRPITSTSWANRDEAFYEVVCQLRTIIETWEAVEEGEDKDEEDINWTYRDIDQGSILQSKQTEALRATSDHTIQALNTLSSGLAKILMHRTTNEEKNEQLGPPFDESLLPLPKHFVGRVIEQRWLTERLKKKEPICVTALSGLAGIGKTALIATVVHQTRAEGNFTDGIAVVICQNIIEEAEILRQILTRFDPHRRAPSATSLAHLADISHVLLNQRNALVVLDNIEPNVNIKTIIQILQKLNITLLISSRQTYLRDIVPANNNCILKLLSPDEALELFIHSFGKNEISELSSVEYSSVRRIVKALGHHTLAIKLAGAYAGDTQRDLKAFANELENPQHAINLPDGETPRAVALTFAQSIESLSTDAQQLFVALAAFFVPDFSRNIVLNIARALNLVDPENSVYVLILRNLLDTYIEHNMNEEGDYERLRLHPLIHVFARTEFIQWPQEKREIVYATMALYYCRYVNEKASDAISRDETNILGILEWAHRENQEKIVAVMGLGIGNYWDSQKTIIFSLDYLQWGIDAAEVIANETTEGEEAKWVYNLLLVRQMLNYGNVLRLNGRINEARQVLQKALKRINGYRQTKEDEGLCSDIESRILLALGDFCLSLRQLVEAKNYYEQRLGINHVMQDELSEAVTLSRLGDLAQVQGNLQVAQQCYENVLTITHRLGNQANEGGAFRGLGKISDNLTEAKGYYEKALNIYQTLLDKRKEAEIFVDLANLYQEQKLLKEAKAYYEQALNIYRTLQNSQKEAEILVNLGYLLQISEIEDGAHCYYEQALQISRLLHDRLGEANAISALGLFALHHEQLDDAERYISQALNIYQEQHNQANEWALLSGLAMVAIHHGNLEKAEEFYKKALDVCNSLGDKGSEIIVFKQLIDLYDKNGKIDDVEKCYDRILSIYEDMENYQSQAYIFKELANFFVQNEQKEKAEKYYQNALATVRKSNHRQAEAVILTEIGELVRRIGRVEEAEQYYEEALIIAQNLQNPLLRRKILSDLGLMAFQTTQLDKAETFYMEAWNITCLIQDKSNEMECITYLALIAQIYSEADKIEGCYRRALAVAREVGNKNAEGVVLTALGKFFHSLKKTDEAEKYYSDALLVTQETQNKLYEGAILFSLGDIAFSHKLWQKAENCYQKSLEVCQELIDTTHKRALFSKLGTVALFCMKLEDAQNYYEQSLIISCELQNRRDEAEDLYLLAIVNEASGTTDLSEKYYRASLAICRETHDDFGTAEVLCLLGRFLCKQRGQYEEGYSLLSESRMLYEKVNSSEDAQGIQFMIDNMKLNDHIREI